MNNYDKHIYIAGCVFARMYPSLNVKVQEYIKKRFGMQIMRCCTEKYKVKEFEEELHEEYRKEWCETPQFIRFNTENIIVSICHNCTAIFQEKYPEIRIKSVWELILEDKNFKYPDYKGESMTLQDCWRTYDNVEEQNAVRELMKRMNINIVELEENCEKTMFCGISVLRPAPRRNLIMAPVRFVQNAPKGFFLPHTAQEQADAMKQYAKVYETSKVVTYCHYCDEGLKLTDKISNHLAEMLFG